MLDNAETMTLTGLGERDSGMDSTPTRDERQPAFARDLPRTRAALEFADERHAGQRRETDDAPFVVHPIEVASLLHEAGYQDDVIAAGVLHDVIENSDTKPAEITERFGSRIALLVTAVTENPAIADRAERKAALRFQVARAGETAAAVFAADKISRTRELRLRAGRAPLDRAARAKLDHYRASLEMLARLIPDHELVEQLRSELDAVEDAP
jgi:(p)ppGpp synthase/HD superfamily hydrolase